jgi:ribonucleotide reductase beta subunit family protein with ferritin-like domain
MDSNQQHLSGACSTGTCRCHAQALAERTTRDQETMTMSEAHDVVSDGDKVPLDPEMEPLLKETSARFILFPIKYQKLWDMYKKHFAAIWQASEIDMAHDMKDWQRLTYDERHFIKMVLGFFATADSIVGENLVERFCREVMLPEARAFYGVQLMMEGVHLETYSLLLDTYVKDPEENRSIFNALENYPTIQRKAMWAQKWIKSSSASFAERLVAFAAVEGIFFSGSFCAIFWLKKRNLMPGLAQSNELISRDEGLHQTFACLLYEILQFKLPVKTVLCIIKSAVEIEQDFINDALPCALLGMNAAMMSQYIEFCADVLLQMLHIPPHYKVRCPFDWMEAISMERITNFFERKVTEYQLADKSSEFNTDAEF